MGRARLAPGGHLQNEGIAGISLRLQGRFPGCCRGVTSLARRRQPPLLPVLFGRQIIMTAEMALEGFEFLAVLKADQIIGGYGFL